MCSLPKRTIHTIKEDNSKCFFFSELYPFFDLDFFVLYQAPHSRVLPPSWSALVSILAQSASVKLINHALAIVGLMNVIDMTYQAIHDMITDP